MRIEGQGSTDRGHINQAGVDKEGRLTTRSVIQDDTSHAVDEGRAFQTYSGVMNLVGSTQQIVFFLENNENDRIFVTSATIGTSVATDSSDNIILAEQVGGIVDADAIVVSGVDATTSNRNIGNVRKFKGVAKAGPQAPSTNEITSSGVLGDFTSIRPFEITAEVPTGGSFGVAITPPALNAGMDVTIHLEFHIKETL